MSERQRLSRAERVVEIRDKAAEAAQRELGAAEAELRACAARTAEAEAELRHAGDALGAGMARADQWSDAEAHLRTLSHARDRAQHAEHEARRVVDARRAALVEARRTLRTMELWRDGILAAMRSAAERTDRARTDEAAARVTRR